MSLAKKIASIALATSLAFNGCTTWWRLGTRTKSELKDTYSEKSVEEKTKAARGIDYSVSVNENILRLSSYEGKYTIRYVEEYEIPIKVYEFTEVERKEKHFKDEICGSLGVSTGLGSLLLYAEADGAWVIPAMILTFLGVGLGTIAACIFPALDTKDIPIRSWDSIEKGERRKIGEKEISKRMNEARPVSLDLILKFPTLNYTTKVRTDEKGLAEIDLTKIDSYLTLDKFLKKNYVRTYEKICNLNEAYNSVESTKVPLLIEFAEKDKKDKKSEKKMLEVEIKLDDKGKIMQALKEKCMF